MKKKMKYKNADPGFIEIQVNSEVQKCNLY